MNTVDHNQNVKVPPPNNIRFAAIANLKCFASLIIIISPTDLWFVIALWKYSLNLGVLFIVLGGLITALQITAAQFCLNMENGMTTKPKRLMVLIFNVVGAAYQVALLIVWVTIIVYASQLNYYAMLFITCFAIDASLKIPLIVLMLLMGSRVFKYIRAA